MAFIGLSHSFEELYQSMRRIYRFGQKRECNVHIIISELDLAILANVKRKQLDAERLVSGLVQAMAERTREKLEKTARQSIAYTPETKMEVPQWLLQQSM